MKTDTVSIRKKPVWEMKPKEREAYEADTVRKYEIVRMYYPDSQGNTRRARRTGSGLLTLNEAQAHCRDPKTRKDGVYFDGYQEA
jgi:hypothetical protein